MIADDLLERTLEVIADAASTGKIGDGKIFATGLEQVIRIHTGETGEMRENAAGLAAT